MGKYYIITYGCQMNLHESEKIAGILSSMGYDATNSESNADIIVFNTCCIRENAEQKVYGHLGALKPYKKANPDVIVAVGGGKVEDGKLIPMTVKVGDKVIASKYAGTIVKLDGVEYTILTEDDILAIVE